MTRYTLQQALISVLLILVSSAPGAQDSLPNLIPNQMIGPQRPFEENPATTWRFGYSVSMSGKTALVGMFAWNDSSNSGRIAVFSQRGKVWKRTGTIEPLDPVVGDSFGENVLALPENLALITGGGPIYAFRRVGQEWQQLRKIEGLYGQLTGQDHTVAVDAGFDSAGMETVEIYRVRGQGGMRLMQTLTTGEGVSGVGFGIGLTMSHHTLAIGASGADDGRGAVYVFNREHSRWVKRQKLVISEAGGGFGYALVMDADLMAVTGPGGLYVFKRVGGLWSQQQTIEPPPLSFSFGDSLALQDGTLAVGGSALLNGTEFHAHVLLYQWNGQEFVLAAQALSPHSSDALVRVALSRSALLAGYPYFPNDIDIAVGHGELFDFHHCLFSDSADALAQQSLRQSRWHDDALGQLCGNPE